MSFRAPQIRKRRSSNSPSKTTSKPTAQRNEPPTPIHHHLVEPQMVPRRRRGYGTKGLVTYRPEVLLAEPRGRVFTQPLFVAANLTRPHVQPIGDSGDFDDDPFAMEFHPESDQPQSPARLHKREVEPIPTDRLKAQRKRERQWAKWANVTIPSMVQPYLQYLYSTQSLRDSPPNGFEHRNACNCGQEGLLTVTCVYFERELSPFFWGRSGKCSYFSSSYRTKVCINQTLQVLSCRSQPAFSRPDPMHSHCPYIGRGHQCSRFRA